MFEKVLVPLDSSPLAETVLPYVEVLAGRLSLDVILIQMVSVPTLVHSGDFYYAMDTGPIQEELLDEAKLYLEGVATRFRDKGIPARWTVAIGVPAAEMVTSRQVV